MYTRPRLASSPPRSSSASQVSGLAEAGRLGGQGRGDQGRRGSAVLPFRTARPLILLLQMLKAPAGAA